MVRIPYISAIKFRNHYINDVKFQSHFGFDEYLESVGGHIELVRKTDGSGHYLDIVFEKDEDAVMFQLKWL